MSQLGVSYGLSGLPHASVAVVGQVGCSADLVVALSHVWGVS